MALPWAHGGEHRSRRFAAWAERLWRRPAAHGLAALILLVVLAVPVLGLRTGMPSIPVVPRDDSSGSAASRCRPPSARALRGPFRW